MKKGGGSESTIIIGPPMSVLAYALHSLGNVLGLGRFRVFVPKLLLLLLLLLLLNIFYFWFLCSTRFSLHYLLFCSLEVSCCKGSVCQSSFLFLKRNDDGHIFLYKNIFSDWNTSAMPRFSLIENLHPRISNEIAHAPLLCTLRYIHQKYPDNGRLKV